MTRVENYPFYWHDLHTSVATTYICFLFLVIFLAFIGNILFCATVYSSKNMRDTTTNMYLCNISCCHIIASFLAVFTVDNILENWKTGLFICKMTYSMIHVNNGIVSFTLLMLHLEEYIKINYLKFYQHWKISKQWKKLVAFTWIIVSLWNIPMFLFYEVHTFKSVSKSGYHQLNEQTQSCVLNMKSGRKLQNWCIIIMHLMSFVIIALLNFLIRRKLHHLSLNVANSGGLLILLEKRKKSMKLFSVLFILHFLLGSPQVILRPILDLDIFFIEISQNIFLFFKFLYFTRYSLYMFVYVSLYEPCLKNVKEITIFCF